MELGFFAGHTITPAHSAPGGDPRVFQVDGSEIALRWKPRTLDPAIGLLSFYGRLPRRTDGHAPATSHRQRAHIIAIAGPPNSRASRRCSTASPDSARRSRIFRASPLSIAWARQLDHHREVYVIDLPGVYNLRPRTEDEQVTHDVLTGTMKGLPRPDRPLMLILGLDQLNRIWRSRPPSSAWDWPTLIILNMADDLERARRPGRCGGVIQEPSRAGCAGQRGQGVGVDKSSISFGANSARRPSRHCSSCRHHSGRPQGPRLGANIGRQHQLPAPRRRPCGPAVWTPFFFASRGWAADLHAGVHRRFPEPFSRARGR